MSDQLLDKINATIDLLLSKDKGEYKFIKDLNHKNFPGPGFIRTKTGWSNREEKTSVGNSENDDKNLSNIEGKKEPPVIKVIDSINNDSIFAEGLQSDIYFCVLYSLNVESENQTTIDNIKRVISKIVSENNLDVNNMNKEGYKKILKGLHSEFDLAKVYWCNGLN